MAIQLRRGAYADFDPTKLLPGEFAVVVSGDPASGTGRSLYICFEPGIVKRITSYEDFEREIESATKEIKSAFTADIQAKIAACTTAINAANAAKSAADQAAAAANRAAAAANAYVLGDISDKTVTFSQASVRDNIASGDSAATMFGKIRKWFVDIKTAAFCTVANNCTTNTEGSVLDARQGKALQEQINELNTNLAGMGELVHLTESIKTEWNSFPVPDLSAFRYIVFDINDGNLSHYPSAIYPMGIFKLCSNVNRTAMLCEWENVKCYACYTGDTSINIYIGGAARQVTVYGIK